MQDQQRVFRGITMELRTCRLVWPTGVRSLRWEFITAFLASFPEYVSERLGLSVIDQSQQKMIRTSSHFKLIFAPWEISGILHSVGGTPELCLDLIPVCSFGGLADFGCPWSSWFLCVGRLLCRSPLGRTSGLGVLLSLRDRLVLHPVILLGVGCICLFTLGCVQRGVPSRFWLGDSIRDFLIVRFLLLPCNGLLGLCSQGGISLLGRGEGSSNETKLEIY